MRTDRLMREYDLRIYHTQFPLHPDTPPEGRSLEDLFAGRRGELEAMRSRLPLLMAREGLAYGDRSMTYNSRLAQELAKWVEYDHPHVAIHQVLFRAYFVEALDVSDPEVLASIAGRVGLPVQEARAVIRERRFQEPVDADWNRSLARGVTAVPTYVVGNRGLVGAQPYEALEALVLSAGAVRRST